MWMRMILTGTALALVLYLQFFYDFKTEIPSETNIETAERESPSK